MTTLTAATATLGGSAISGQLARPASDGASGFTGADAARILRQRLVLICVLWILLSAAATGGTLIWYFYYPDFVASAYIRVDSLRPPDVTDPLNRGTTDEKEIGRELKNQALAVVGPDVLDGVLKDPDFRETNWFSEAAEEAKREGEKLEDLLKDILSVAPLPDTNFIRVSGSWKFPKEVDNIVNTVVRYYMEGIKENQKRAIGEAEEGIGRELETAKNALEAKKRDIDDFRRNEEFSPTTGQQANEQLLTLTALVTELEVEMLGRKTQWEALERVDPEQMPITPDLQAILAQDPAINQLEHRLMLAEENLNIALQRFGEKHRSVMDARFGRDAAAERVAQEQAVKILRYQTQQIQQAKRNYLEAQDQLLALREKMISAKAEQRDKDVNTARYESLVDERGMLRFQYENLLEKKNILSMTKRWKQTVQVQVQSSAVEPLRISSPKLEIVIPAGSFLALAISVGIAFLLELTDKSVRTSRDMLRSQLPVLGTIPTTDDDEVEIDRVETACLDAPHSIVSEAFRNLRANLFFSAPAEQQGVILVTSPSGGNGKTTVATNLAISIALSGRRVLLVDANFRRAALPRVFPGMKPDGLSNILIGQGFLKDYVTETRAPGLDVLSAGPIPPNPAELLGSSYLRDVVVDARSRYDQVIFDGPPVLLVSDAMVLAGAVDGCLLVCEYRQTSRGALQRTQTNLEAINARIFGAVLNSVQTRAGGYFRKIYREFYEYHEADEGHGGTPTPRLDSTKTAAEKAPAGDLPGSTSGRATAGAVATLGTANWAAGASQADLADTDTGDGGDLNIARALNLDTPAAPAGDLSASDLDSDLTDLDSDEFTIDDEFDLGDDLGDESKLDP